MIYGQLFLVFLQVGLFSVGGGYAALPLIQSLVVDQHAWLTLEEFSNLIVIAEMTPGPIAVNSATFVGLRLAGIGGAIVATFGGILPSLVMVSILSWLYMRYRKENTMQTVLSSLRPTVVGLIAGAAVTIFLSVAFPGVQAVFANIHWVNIGLAASAFFALRKLHWAPIPMMLGCGAIGLLLYQLGVMT